MNLALCKASWANGSGSARAAPQELLALRWAVVCVRRILGVHWSPQAVSNTLVNDTYLLYQCGTAPPVVANGGNLFEIPLTSVSVPDTVPYAFLVSQRLPGWGPVHPVCPCSLHAHEQNPSCLLWPAAGPPRRQGLLQGLLSSRLKLGKFD